MLQPSFIDEITELCGNCTIKKDVLLKDYTTIRVGGMADYLIEPDSVENVQKCIAILNKASIPFFVMGNGSNLVFADQGYRGVIIKIGSKISKIEVKDNIIIAEAGTTLSAVANRACEHSLTGLEFASGIPGSTGGGACMNAGAYDGEMKQVIIETVNINVNGELIVLKGDEHNFSYRHSKIQEDNLICIKAIFRLEKGNREEIQSKMNDLNTRRREKQPLNMPSAGSVFKRPPEKFAGKLIEDCGLRGFKIGGAQVSQKHCGFIVNTGNATAKDIICLIKHIQNTVYEKTGTLLEPEVKIIGGNS